MEIIKQPDSFCFASALTDIIVSSDVAVTVSFSVSGLNPFLTETYHPDAAGRIVIRELVNLFLPLMPLDTLKADFKINLTSATGEVQNINFAALYCRADMGYDFVPAAWIQNNFLTLCQGEKTTHLGINEQLSIYTTEPTTVELIAEYNTGERFTKNIEIASINQITTINASIDWVEHPEQVSRYVVNAGNRHFSYLVKPALPREHLVIAFRNAFGVTETFIPSGITLRENKYDNLFGQFSGNYRKYKAEVTKTYTCNTGILTGTMADWLEDLFMSDNVALFDIDNGYSYPIVIEESTVKRSTAASELPAFEFKFRPAKRNQLDAVPAKPRIFDNSFDHIFN
ncbi:MAG: hypothetical protein LBV74_01090 [Tannerella sp.]|jgi:hypothetical protein|nr:hypothetical protein [Tannerella sp.]